MAAELPESQSAVGVELEDTPSGEPLAWVKVKRPGAPVAEELRYSDLMATPSNIEEDRAIKREATRQYRALKKDWRPKPPSTERSEAFEIMRVISDRSPFSNGFDPTKHLTVYYVLDGAERRDTPASLNRAIQAHPERYPGNARSLIAIAVRERERSLREQCRPAEAPTPDPAPEDVPTAAPETSPVKEESPSDPPVHPLIGEAEGINRLLKTVRERGEEAAIAEKREEEAPRVMAHDRELEEEREVDNELLRSGGWWDVVDGAIDEFLAGEPMLRKIIVYSALSTGTHGKGLHLMAIGDSQVGKSYALRSIGSKLFPELFIDVAAMSAKALYYAADEAGNPRLFDGKVLFVDELADQGDGTLDFIKAAMSHGAEKLISMTVDEHRKSKIQALEGLPIIWSTSAEILEDAEGQIMNRPFVVNPDETAEQTRKILDFQRDAVSVGLLKASDSRIPIARRLLARILEEKEFTVYNLFARHVRIREDDARARNTLPMFFNLVDAITYANRYARPVIELPDGRKLLFASWSDNIEAAELWGWASGSKSTGLPNRHIELLKILPVFAGTLTGGMELDEIVDAYKKKTGRPVSHKTLRNYLSDLSSKDKATYYETEDGRHLWYSTGSSHTFPTASQLLVGMESDEGNKLLDEAQKSLEEAISQLPDEIRERTEGMREKVLEGRRGA